MESVGNVLLLIFSDGFISKVFIILLKYKEGAHTIEEKWTKDY